MGRRRRENPILADKSGPRDRQGAPPAHAVHVVHLESCDVDARPLGGEGRERAVDQPPQLLRRGRQQQLRRVAQAALLAVVRGRLAKRLANVAVLCRN